MTLTLARRSSSVRSACSEASQGIFRSPREISVGERRISRRSGNKSDTVDLLQRGLALAHRVERGIAQEARAAAARRFLQLAQRRAAGDELAQLVVQDHELGDRLAALVAR